MKCHNYSTNISQRFLNTSQEWEYLLTFAFHINHNLRTSTRLPHWNVLSPVSHETSYILSGWNKYDAPYLLHAFSKSYTNINKLQKSFRCTFFLKAREEQYDVLRDLVPFVQFKKREKHPWGSVNFKVAGFKPATLRKLSLLLGVFHVC